MAADTTLMEEQKAVETYQYSLGYRNISWRKKDNAPVDVDEYMKHTRYNKLYDGEQLADARTSIVAEYPETKVYAINIDLPTPPPIDSRPTRDYFSAAIWHISPSETFICLVFDTPQHRQDFLNEAAVDGFLKESDSTYVKPNDITGRPLGRIRLTNHSGKSALRLDCF